MTWLYIQTTHVAPRVWGLAKPPRLGKELCIILHQLNAAIMTEMSQAHRITIIIYDI